MSNIENWKCVGEDLSKLQVKEEGGDKFQGNLKDF